MSPVDRKKVKSHNSIHQLSGTDEFIELLKNPRKLGALRFYSGLMSGIGATFGAALALVILAFAVKYLGGIPWLGNLLHQISTAAHLQ